MQSRNHAAPQAFLLCIVCVVFMNIAHAEVAQNPFSETFDKRIKYYKTLLLPKRKKQKQSFSLPNTKRVVCTSKNKRSRLKGPNLHFSRNHCHKPKGLDCSGPYQMTVTAMLKQIPLMPRKLRPQLYLAVTQQLEKKESALRCKKQQKYAKVMQRWYRCRFRAFLLSRQKKIVDSILWFKLAQKYERTGNIKKAAMWYTLYYLHDRILKVSNGSKQRMRIPVLSSKALRNKRLLKKKALTKASALYWKLNQHKLSILLWKEKNH